MDSAAPALIVHSHRPFNAEPMLARLRAASITPQAGLYVRNHGDVPQLDAARHRIRVTGKVARELQLSVSDLRRHFAERTVTAVLQCAGNRRADLQGVRPTSGDLWQQGAIGNVQWCGVALADVLREAGAPDARAPGGASLHVAFGCCDAVELPEEGRFRFGVSSPLGKAMAPETLLAFGMNGEALAPEHGFPLRVVVPGWAGVRSAKWLNTITVQGEPSDNPVQQRDYKLFPPEVTDEPLDWAAGLTIEAMPLNSAICDPAPGDALPAGPTRLQGYAVAAPGRHVARVEVSAGGGQWMPATLAARSADAAPWGWTLWAATLPLNPGPTELAVRAWDSAGQTQPASAAEVWNLKGYLCTAWHRVAVTVC